MNARKPLLVTLEMDWDTARTVRHAMELALARGAYMPGEKAALQGAHDDLLLALLGDAQAVTP